jgi:hypothetical protein
LQNAPVHGNVTSSTLGQNILPFTV